MLSALKEQPEDSGLREEIRQTSETLKNDADLVADTALGEQTKAILTALDGGMETTPQLEQAMSMLKPDSEGPARSFAGGSAAVAGQHRRNRRGTSVHFP